MPIASQVGLKRSKTTDVEKSRKTAHREAIARANLALVKQAIDRSSGFRVNQITQDQRHIYRRFQVKLLNSQLHHARMYGDTEKLREVKLKLRSLRLINEDEEYDFFRKVASEASRERSRQGKRPGTASLDTSHDKKGDTSESSSSDEENEHILSTSRSVTFSDLSTPSPRPKVPHHLSRIQAQSAKTLGRIPEAPDDDNQKPSSSRSVTFKDNQDLRSKSCGPQIQVAEASLLRQVLSDPQLSPSPVPTSISTSAAPSVAVSGAGSPTPPPPKYEPVESRKLVRPQSSRRLESAVSTAAASVASTVASVDTEATIATVATTDIAINAVAVANDTSSSPEPRTKSSLELSGQSERTMTTSGGRLTARPQTTTNIFMKKTGPTKLEVHALWMEKRNYRGVVQEFCDSLFHQEEPPPPPTPVPPPTPGKDDGKNKRKEPAKQEPAAAKTPPASTTTPAATPVVAAHLKPVKNSQPTAFDYSDLFLQDTAVKRKPILEVPLDPTEYRREGGNPNVRNLTMLRVTFT